MASKKGLFGNPLMIIGLILLVAAAVFIWKKMKGKTALPGPTMDTIAANQARAVQQAHAARLTCSSCGGH